MKRILTIILLLPLFVKAQTVPTTPVQMSTASWWYDTTTGLKWLYNGTGHAWNIWSQLGSGGIDSVSQGLTHYGAYYGLGGNLIGNVNINTNGNNLNIGGAYGSVSIGDYNGGDVSLFMAGSNYKSQLKVSADDGTIIATVDTLGHYESLTVSQAGVIINNGISGIGARYANDVSALGKSYNLWLPTWGAVKSRIDSASSGISSQFLSLTGSNQTISQTPVFSTGFSSSTDILVNGKTIGYGSKSGGGFGNVAFGADVLLANVSGNSNTGIGDNALQANTTGFSNTAIGTGSLNSVTSGNANTAIGVSALSYVTTAASNTAVGYGALSPAAIGNNNTAIGVNAGAGSKSTLGSGGVFIGYLAGQLETGSNKLYIANTNTSSPLIYGDFSASTLLINGKLSSTVAPTNPNDVVRLSDLSGIGTWGTITGSISAQTDLQSALSGKQATLVSGTNIKTINSTALTGSGNIALQTPLVAGTDYLTPANNLLDLSNITAARDNLRVSGRLRSLTSKASMIQQGFANTTVNFMQIGDSIARDLLSYNMISAFMQSYGPYTSQDGGGAYTGVGYTYAGGATALGSPIQMLSLTSSGTTATVTTAAAHGLSTGNTVIISGATNSVYNVTATVTVSSSTVFTYTIASSTTSPDPSPNIYFTLNPDFTKWITGTYTSIPSGGSYAQNKSTTSPGYANGFTNIKIYYLTEVGGGTFKVQTSLDGVTWTDVSGFTSISTVDTQNNMKVLNVPNPSAPTAVQYRIVGVSGTTLLAGMGYGNTVGAKISTLLAVGGTLLSDYATCPARIWATYLKDFQPDVIVEYFYDPTTTAYSNALSTIQGYFSAYCPNAAVIYPSPYNTYQDDPGYVPTPAYGVTVAAQTAAIQTFLAADTNATEKYFWDANHYIGTWETSAAMGMHDSNTPVAISSLSISGTTITVTTSAPHNISTGNYVRIIGAIPAEYNGLYLTCTVTSSTTLTVTAGSVTPTASGSGGTIAPVDGIHLSEQGRAILSLAFLRDFPMGAAGIASSNGVTSNGGLLNGDYSNASTTEANGTSTESSGDATGSFKTAGGIYAAKGIRTDEGVYIGGGSLPNSAFALYSNKGSTNASINGGYFSSNIIVSSSGNYTANPLQITSSQTMSGTASNGANQVLFTSNGIMQGSGTGSDGMTGIASMLQNTSAGSLNAVGFYSSLVNNSRATISGYKAFNADITNSGTISNPIFAYNVTTGFNGNWGFYNAGTAINYFGSGTSLFGFSQPTITPPTVAAIDLVSQSNSKPGFVLEYPKFTCNTLVASGASVSVDFTGQHYSPYPVGSTIILSGFTPSGYNGTYTVTSTNGIYLVTFASTTTGTVTTYGTIEPGLLTTPVYGALERDAFNIYTTDNNGIRHTISTWDNVESLKNKTLDKIRLTTGSNTSIGSATLASGTVTISNTSITASSKVIAWYSTISGTIGQLLQGTTTPGTGFVINSNTATGSLNISDNSTINYLILN